MNTLYAKSKPTQRMLKDHTNDVREVADAITDCIGTDLGDLIPGLSTNLPKLLTAAALLHDLLKANTAFQKVLALPRGQAPRQPVRHEVLAAVLLSGDGPLAGWLVKLLPDEADRWAVVWAVAAHHFKMTDPAREKSGPLFNDKETDKSVTLHLDDEQVHSLLAEAHSTLEGVGDPPRPARQHYSNLSDDGDDSLRELVRRYPVVASVAWKKLKANPTTRVKIAVLKALLTSSDAGGSALLEHNRPRDQWTRNALGVRLTPEDLDGVLAKDREKGFREFQHKVAASDKSVTIVAAGCGNGKTTAGYLWAQKWAKGKKLFFTYPTTGTSTAGYQGYLADQHNLPTELIHGRSEVDMAQMRARGDEGEKREQRADEETRIDSLRAWDRKVVVCTVDTVLGLLQNQRRGVYSFPAFAAGAFVFDELHAYDARLFGGLLRFLETFPGVPALLMSASIPPARLDALRVVLDDRAGEVIRGDATIEGYKRYQLERRESADDCRERVAKALKDGQKVLWVCNTVKDAIALAKSAKEWTDVTPVVYHSRFKYDHRVKRQNAVFKEFEYDKTKTNRLKPGPTLVIATQVCEMSLDISADLMVTAECPLPSLVQRLGRLNRYATSDDPWPCLVYPFEGLPYNEKPESIDLHGDQREGMTAIREAVKGLNGQPCSQTDLAKRLEEMKTDATPEKYSAWLDDGWVTQPMPVRDGDQTMTVILQEDSGCKAKDRPKWTIPMTFRQKIEFSDYAGPYPVATAGQVSYSEAEGAEWV